MDKAQENKTALEFETVALGGFVFETEDAPPMEKAKAEQAEALSATEAEEQPTADSFEFSFGEDLEPSERKVEKEIIDEPKIRRTYVPRFTEVSERFRSASPVMKSTGAEKNTFPNPAPAENTVDPTAELDDDSEVKKVVVTTGVEADAAFLDESIKIYKFANTEADENKKEIPIANKPETEAADPIPEVPKEEAKAEEIPEAEPVPDAAGEEQKREEKLMPTPLGKIAENEEPKGARKELADKKRPSEFTSFEQRDSFKDVFLDALMSVRIRLTAIILIMLSLVVAEIVFLTVSPSNMVGFLAGGGVLVDLLFSSALFALAIPEFFRAAKGFVRGSIAPEVILPISYSVILIYSLIAATLGETGARYMHFSLPFSVTVLFAVLASYLRISSNFKSFKLIASGRDMWVLDKRFTRTLERENIALDGAVDEYNSKIARVFRTSFVLDFKENSETSHENTANVVTVSSVSIAAALLLGTITLLLSNSSAPLSRGLEAFAAVFFFTVPAVSVLVHKLFFNRLIKSSAKLGHTFIGENAVMDTAQIDVMAYDDTEMLGGVAIKKMHLYGKVYNTEKALSEMYSLYTSVGGPLLQVFSDALSRKCTPAENVTLFDNGIVGYYEGHRIMAGSYDFMVGNNVKIPDEDSRASAEPAEGEKVMYGAEDGEVYVKFIIKYSFTESFETAFSDYRSYGIVPLVYTRDPNVDGELLKTLTHGEDRIRVFKLRDLMAPPEVYPHVSTDAVSLAEKSAVPKMLNIAREYSAKMTLSSFAELFLMLLGAVISSVAVFCNIDTLSAVPSLIYLVWQLVQLSVLPLLPRLAGWIKDKNKD